MGIPWDELSKELKEKFQDNGAYILNLRLEAERQKRVAYKKKQTRNGKKGGRPKKENQNKNKSIIKEKPIKSQKKPLEDENENENKDNIDSTITIKKGVENFEKK